MLEIIFSEDLRPLRFSRILVVSVVVVWLVCGFIVVVVVVVFGRSEVSGKACLL